MDRVSVITAAYNAAGVIERNVRCVAAQSLAPVEHIIVDDGSVDDTHDIAERLGAEFAHLRIIRQEHAGAAQARNAGIEAATGRYLAFLDCDDTWTAAKLEAQIGFMSRNDVAFSYGDYFVADAASARTVGRFRAPERVGYADLLRGCPIGCLTAAFDQRRLGKHFMSEVQRGQDWGLWLELTRNGTQAGKYPGCHATYYRNRGSLSSDKIAKAADIYRIYREHERLGPIRSLALLLPHVVGSIGKRNYDDG